MPIEIQIGIFCNVLTVNKTNHCGQSKSKQQIIIWCFCFHCKQNKPLSTLNIVLWFSNKQTNKQKSKINDEVA